MDDDHEINHASVDRREEMVVTHHPGYTATEQVVYDVAAERRMEIYQVKRILWGGLLFLEIMLAARFLLRLVSANPESGFAMIMYGITGVLVAPFYGLVATPTPGGSPLELTTLIAMFVYFLIFWGFAFFIQIILDRPTARSFSRKTREQMPGGEGNERTTHTTITNRKMK